MTDTTKRGSRVGSTTVTSEVERVPRSVAQASSSTGSLVRGPRARRWDTTEGSQARSQELRLRVGGTVRSPWSGRERVLTQWVGTGWSVPVSRRARVLTTRPRSPHVFAKSKENLGYERRRVVYTRPLGRWPDLYVWARVETLELRYPERSVEWVRVWRSRSGRGA